MIEREEGKESLLLVPEFCSYWRHALHLRPRDGVREAGLGRVPQCDVFDERPTGDDVDASPVETPLGCTKYKTPI